MSKSNRWFIIPKDGLTDQERMSIEPDITGSFVPDTQRYSIDGSKYIIHYNPINETAECLTQFKEYTYGEISIEIESDEWTLTF